MKIFHYRNPDYDADPWNDAIINGNTNLNDFCPKTILSINGCNILRQHYSTYITGKNTSNAHHFAKMIAAAVLKGSFTLAPGLSVDLQQSQQGTVLWVDSVHSVHACADFFKEMITNFDPDNKNFYLFSLDRLGTFRYDFYALLNCFEKAVRETNPTLIVIDDIDSTAIHFKFPPAPHSGKVTLELNHVGKSYGDQVILTSARGLPQRVTSAICYSPKHITSSQSAHSNPSPQSST